MSVSDPTKKRKRKATCARCEMTTHWIPNGGEPSRLPPNWEEVDGARYCLVCRREEAVEAALRAAPDDISNKDRGRLRTEALIEFEIERDADRLDSEIAGIVRCSAVAVKKARERLGD